MREPRDPGTRRVRVRRRPSRRAVHARRPRHDALRGHLADPEADHRPRRDRDRRDAPGAAVDPSASESSAPGPWARGSRRSPRWAASRPFSTTRSARRSTAASIACDGTWREAPSGAAGPRATRGGAEARLSPAPHLGDLFGCDLVIEAAPEDLELKRRLFKEAEDLCGPDAILATNTSSLSVTAIAAGVEHRERVVGMHFFNPPALMKLVEIVAGDESGEGPLAEATAVAERMGRTPIRAADGIGFVANRCVRPFSLEALKLVTEGVPHDQVDRIVRMGGGFRMGPFELMDLVGVDVNLEVAKSFWEQSFHEPRWRPSPLQTRLVDAGRLGRKSGRGWYRLRRRPSQARRPRGPAHRAARRSAVRRRGCGGGGRGRARRARSDAHPGPRPRPHPRASS